MAVQLGHLLAAGDINQADGVVAATGGQPRVVFRDDTLVTLGL
jgi:hypothetical protein